MSVDLSILKASATNAEGIAELENDFIALLGPYDAFSREPQPGTLYGGENGELYRRIELALGDQVSYQKLLSQRGERAQYFLDLLQMLYDYPHASDPKVRSNIFSAMIRLSKTSGLYPTCLVLNGVNKIGEHPVSSGGFGEIWKGSIGEQLACLKVVRVYGDPDVQKLLKEFLKEAILWRQLDHPNVLPFLGIYFLDTTKQRVCLISPWMENGNLRRYLRDRSDAHRDVDHFLLSYDIACGLLYLHEKKVIHGDLKAENVLITPTGRAAIADFGLSRVANSEALNWSSLSTSNQGRGGSARWLAPECLIEGNNVTYASDVYAFGGVCYEVFTGLIPFHECTHDAAVIFQLMKGKRPTRPSDASTRLNDEIWAIMQDCWDQEPFERPVTNTLPSRLASGAGRDEIEPANDWDTRLPSHLWESVQRLKRYHQNTSQSKKGWSDPGPDMPGSGITDFLVHEHSVIPSSRSPSSNGLLSDSEGRSLSRLPSEPNLDLSQDFPNVGDNDYASILRTKTLSVSRSASDESDPDLRMGSESQVAQKDKDDWVWIWEYDRGSSLLNYSLLSHIAIELRNRIPRATHIKRGISYPGSFTGKDLVITIKQLIHQELPLGLFYPTFVRDAALQVARSLQSHSFFYEPDSSARGVQDSVGRVYMLQDGSDNGRISGFDSAPSLSTITSTPESNIETLPTGVMTMLTGCYAPTCVGRGPCYALHCPKKSYPLFDVDEGGTEPVPLFSEKSWSQTIPDEILASLPENEINRQTTIQKILQQEAQYIHDLDIVETVFIRPLRYANPPIISPPVALEQFITDVFCNILELRQCSKSLRESILVRQREGQYTIQRVGDILLNIATEYRQVYSVYLGLRTFAERKTRDELEENVQFKTFLEQASEQHFPLERDSTDKPQLALDLLLNRPSEHLQKFLSLLEAVLNETTANHPDMNDLKGAIGMIKAFAQLRTRRLHA